MELSAARRLFEDGSACLWRAVRAGFRGNFPEAISTVFPTSERQERSIYNLMPQSAFCKEPALLPKLEALNRLLNRMNEACGRAIRAPGAPADALTARVLQLRRKADRLISDARNGSLNAEAQVAPFFGEVGVCVTMLEEISEANVEFAA